MLRKHENLRIYLARPSDNEYIYKLAFVNKDNILLLSKEVEKISSVKKIDVNII